jgi:hypothetical protein
MTGIARPLPGDLNPLLGPKSGLLKADIEMIAKVSSPVRTGASSRRPSAKKLAENISEDILKAGGEIKPFSEGASVSEGRMPELVVLSPLLGIGQDLVSLRDFLKLFLRLLVSRISVRVILQRQLPVSLFDLLLSGASTHAENFVIVLFTVQP